VAKVFKVTYNIYELEDGKKINERSYTLPVRTVGRQCPASQQPENRQSCADHTKETTQGSEFQYLDGGNEYRVRCHRAVAINYCIHRVDLSYVISADQIAEPHALNQPIIRSIKENSTTLVYPANDAGDQHDDISSKKRMQMEVTVTRIE